MPTRKVLTINIEFELSSRPRPDGARSTPRTWSRSCAQVPASSAVSWSNATRTPRHDG